MVDEIKKPEEQKPTPLEPPKDIEELLKELPKVDPEGVASRPYGADSPKPPAPSLPPPQPQMPPPPLKPSSPPTSQLPASASPQDDKFKSLVRTMGEDLEAARKGMKPEPKPFEIKPPPSGPKIAPPPPPLKMPPTPQIKLGPAERTRPLELPRTGPPAPPPGGLAPKKFVLNPKALILILVVLIAAFAGVWWFMNREPEIAAPIPTATPIPTPIPTPKSFSELFPSSRQITISSTENFIATFKNSVETLNLGPRDLVLLNIIDESNRMYELFEIVDKFQLNTPYIGMMSPPFALFVYGQTEIFDNKGFLMPQSPVAIKLGFIFKTPPLDNRDVVFRNFEDAMTELHKNIFDLDPKKATSQTFLDNIYGGSDIRYRNFPYADNSIDYTFVDLPQYNTSYFVITNSRESIYSAVDLLQNQ